MRKVLPAILERGRVTKGPFGTLVGSGANGAFLLMAPKNSLVIPTDADIIKVIANAASQLSEWWEHVSVSKNTRTPTWEEMCLVKRLFWDDEECVIQFHPPQSKYVDYHPHCLHLWRDTRHTFKTPPTRLIGPDFGIINREYPLEDR